MLRRSPWTATMAQRQLEDCYAGTGLQVSGWQDRGAPLTPVAGWPGQLLSAGRARWGSSFRGP
eukprot:9109224-Alexandrium_andersonii.AAC.1